MFPEIKVINFSKSNLRPTLPRTMDLKVKSNILMIKTNKKPPAPKLLRSNTKKPIEITTLLTTISATSKTTPKTTTSGITKITQTTKRPTIPAGVAWSRTWSRTPNGAEAIKTWDEVCLIKFKKYVN